MHEHILVAVAVKVGAQHAHRGWARVGRIRTRIVERGATAHLKVAVVRRRIDGGIFAISNHNK